jgi:hypothetical protein
MPTRYQVLGQVAPSATTDTTLYTVPALKDAIVSTLVVANRSGSIVSYRIAVRPDGAALSDEHYIAYEIAVGAADSTTLTLGITLAPSDIITVYASSSALSFSAFGSVIDL